MIFSTLHVQCLLAINLNSWNMQKWWGFFHKILITPLHWPKCAWHKWDSSPLDLFIFNDFAFKINLQKGQSWVTKVSVIRSFWSHFFCYGKTWMEKKIHVQMCLFLTFAREVQMSKYFSYQKWNIKKIFTNW